MNRGSRIAERPRTRSGRFSIGKTVLAAFIASIAAAALFHTQILAGLGGYLQKSDPPRKADVVLVLAGDYSGHRILTAAQLVRNGYAPKVVVSGPQGFYGHHESDLAISFAEQLGYPASYFIPFPNTALSTRQEAAQAVPVLQKIGARQILLVTSNYHTRRAGEIFRAAAPNLNFTVIAAPDDYFTPAGWWHKREGRKIFLIEWMKTVAAWLHM